MRHALSLARIDLLAATDRVVVSVRLEHEVALLRDELRITNARLERVPPRHSPHYSAVDRLAILELRAARGWSAAPSVERLFVTAATVDSWMMRLGEDGAASLVQTPEPVNKFPDLVGHVARRLEVLCPTMGTARIAAALSRAGIQQRIGAIGKHGSIALIECCNRTLKDECVRRCLTPVRWRSVGRELSLFAE